MFSHGCAGGADGIEEHGHASPSETPFTCVRVAGHMLESPSINTDHSVDKDTTGVGAIVVVGCERRKSALVSTAEDGLRATADVLGPFNVSQRVAATPKCDTFIRVMCDSPIMFPGLPSAPNISWFESAFDNLIKSPARPSSPAIGFDSDTCIPFARDTTVILARPSLSTWHG